MSTSDDQKHRLLSEVKKGIKRGWCFTPLRGKVPVRMGWQNETALLLSRLAEYIDEGFNIGLRTGSPSRVCVMDVDRSEDEAVKLREGLPETPTLMTGSGTFHVYFCEPKAHIRNSVGKISPNIDIRSTGGQVVYAGSTHPETGRFYEWIEGLSPDEIPLANFPDWVIERLSGEPKSEKWDHHKHADLSTGNGQTRAYVRTCLENAVRLVASASEGTRNGSLNRASHNLAGYIYTGEIAEAEIVDSLLHASRECGLPEPEARKTIESGIKAGRRRPKEIPIFDQKDVLPSEARTSKTADSSLIRLPSAAPLRLGEAFLESCFTARTRDVTLRRYRDEWFFFDGIAYGPYSEEELRAEIYQFLDQVDFRKGASYEKLVVRDRVVTEVIRALPSLGLLVKGDSPQWLSRDDNEPKPDQIICMKNGLLYVPSLILKAPTPKFFCLNSLPFGYEWDAPPPKTWLRFLDSLFGDDRESINALQEVFGYFLSNDTRQQKIVLIAGPKRSGKGTMGRLLSGLLGAPNVCAPTLSGLSTNFGLQPLLGKSLAIISDARLSGRSDLAVVTERLLSVSGEDAITIDRKHKPPITTKLPTRILILTNELPHFQDSSGALASRLIVISLTKSFYRSEDLDLMDSLKGELSGIFNWALVGLDRLRRNGVLRQPSAGAGAIHQIEELGSPVLAFVRDRRVLGEMQSVAIQELYWCWSDWCEKNGSRPGIVQVFGRNLRACVPTIRTSHPREDGGRQRFYHGVALKPTED